MIGQCIDLECLGSIHWIIDLIDLSFDSYAPAFLRHEVRAGFMKFPQLGFLFIKSPFT